MAKAGKRVNWRKQMEDLGMEPTSDGEMNMVTVIRSAFRIANDSAHKDAAGQQRFLIEQFAGRATHTIETKDITQRGIAHSEAGQALLGNTTFSATYINGEGEPEDIDIDLEGGEDGSDD